MMTNSGASMDHIGASFRDPSGFLFRQDGTLYRQVNQSYRADYDLLMGSGLYEKLVKASRLIPHREIELSQVPPPVPGLAYRVIQPEPVAFISYPYEWSFSQLKDAALLTLSIQKAALNAGMSLKDASAYNIQFHRGRPLLIDTLSFEKYKEGRPWVAYRQFCQHFLAPLALMALKDVRLSQLLRTYIDGIPLDLASALLPASSRLRFGILAHIHLHAAAQKKAAGSGQPAGGGSSGSFHKNSFLGLIESLQKTVRSLTWQPKGTEWASYYDATNYTTQAFEEKASIIRRFLEKTAPHQVWDLGANTGIFSRLASDAGIPTIASDIDPAAVEKNYRSVREKKEVALLPLVVDLTNPSPALGWANRERDSFIDRGPAGLVMALALVHHLAVSNNVPLPDLADFFASLGRWLVIEFIPKTDSQVQLLLATRADIFPNYTQQGFEEAFGARFQILERCPITGSQRILYLMENSA